MLHARVDRTASNNPDPNVTDRGRLVPRTRQQLFRSWGPLLMSLSFGTLPLTSIAGPSSAASGETLHASCIVSRTPPVIASVRSIDRPISLADSSATGTVTVRVDLDERARVRNAEVDKTSGDFQLDQEARRLASRAKFALADGTCMAPASYAIEYDFVTE